tara:strand:+ start:133 stop:1317 length:1185 start_codon:yes stop_codon:yes gene_type:complete
MEHTWRWYGPEDSVTLSDIVQAGATGVVTALHQIPNGGVWSRDDILERKQLIEYKDLTWSVVESLPVHEDIKRHTGNFELYIENYRKSLENLAKCGIHTVCYNFMPVLDWTRTDLAYELPDGSRALRFDQIAFAAFDVHILRRADAERDYSEEELKASQNYFLKMSDEEKDLLTSNILAGLPGSEEGYSLDSFRDQLLLYAEIDKETLRRNLSYFLNEIVPTCEQYGVRLAIHPDDPPRPIFGLPRIVSTKDDIEWLTKEVDSIANGITMCTGSYGVRADNDLADIVRKFGSRVHFTHLRSTQREENPKTFHEASHLAGDVDMYDVVSEILREEHRREKEGKAFLIPMRPDHGHQILDDLKKEVNPGYSAIGRLKGLAEIRGMEMALKRAFFSD